MVAVFDKFNEEQTLKDSHTLVRRIKMKTSARNTLKGTVETVIHGVINSEIILRLKSGTAVCAIVTIESARLLGLVPGKAAYALIKSTWVILTLADEKFTTSARNRLCGVVSRIEKAR